MKPVFVLIGVVCLVVRAVSIDPRARSVVRLEDQIIELEKEINNFQGPSNSIALERQLEAKRMRLDSLRSFYNGQKEVLQAAGVSLNDLDRDAVRQDMQTMYHDMASRNHFAGQSVHRVEPPEFNGLPDIPTPNVEMGHHPNFDVEAIRREHMERIQKLKREHSGLLKTRSIHPNGVPAKSGDHLREFAAHDETMFRDLVQKLGFERAVEIIAEFDPNN